MKKVKSIIAVVLVLGLLSGIIAGCGAKKEPEKTGNQPENSENGSVQAEDTYEIIIELLTYGTVPDDIEMIEAAVNEITLNKINASIKFLPIVIADHATKMSLIATSGEKVDLIMTGITSDPARFHANGVLMEIGELLDEYAPELVQIQSELLKAGRIGGGIYAVPGFLYPGGNSNLVYNKQMAEEYGIEIPQELNSYEDFDTFFAEAKSKLPEDIYVYTLGDGGNASSVNWDSQFDTMGDGSHLSYGVLTDLDNGKEISNWYEGEKYKLMVEKRREWYEAGYCVPDSMTSGYSTTDCIAAGTCFAFESPFDVSYNEVTLSKRCGVELGYINLSESVITTGSTMTMSWGVPVTSEKPQKVVEFMNLMFTDVELMNLLNYGIEGQHYEKISERIIDYPEGVDSMTTGWGGFVNWFGDNAKAYQFAPITEAFYDELYLYGLEGAKVSIALGYSFDSSSVKTELAAISTVISQHKPSLDCGLVDVSQKLPEFIAALKDAGIETVIAENQRQYTEWLDSKQ